MFTTKFLMDFFYHCKEKNEQWSASIGWNPPPTEKIPSPYYMRNAGQLRIRQQHHDGRRELDRWQQMGGNEQVALRIAELAKRRLSSGGQALALEPIDLSTGVRWITKALYYRGVVTNTQTTTKDRERRLSGKSAIKDVLLYHHKDTQINETQHSNPDLMRNSVLMPRRNRVDAGLLIMLPKCPAWNTLVSPYHPN